MMDIYEKWFAGYTAELRDLIVESAMPAVLDEVDLKIEHTYRVQDICKQIAKWLKLSERDIQLAEIIGLFHDLGRFAQAIQFGTMDDRITGSHGEMSADIFLYEAPKSDLTGEEISIIESALRNHNVFRLSKTLNERQLFFTQLARDGDKLDIFRFYTDKNEKRTFRFIMPTTPGEYSLEMLAGVLKGENLRVSGVRNSNDRKLMQISLVYDMNFGYSFQHMLEKDYLGMVTGVADGTADDIMKKVYDYATKWMKDKLEKSQ